MAQGKTIAIVLVGCAGFGVLLIAGCAGLLFVGFRNTDAAVSPRVDAMFRAIERGEFADTYETATTEEFRSVTTKQQYAAIGEAISTNLGRLKSKSLQGFNMQQVNADSFVDATYGAEFEKGSGTILARMKKEGESWKFVSFRVNSPLFLQDASKQATAQDQPGPAEMRLAAVEQPPAADTQPPAIPAEIEKVLTSPSLKNVPRFVELLKHDNYLVRQRSAVMIGFIGASSPDVFKDHHDSVVAALAGALADDHINVAQGAAFSLEQIGPGAKDAVPALIEALQSSKDLVPLMASRALGAIGPPAAEAVPTLIENLKSPKRETRQGAALALGKMGPAAHAAIPLLIKELDGVAGDFAATSLGELGQTKPLLNLVGSDDFTARMRGLKALAKVQPMTAEILSVIRRAKSDEEELVRETAAKVLDEIEARDKD